MLKSQTLKRMFCTLVSLTFVLSGMPFSFAQTVDITAPVITHSIAEPGFAGDNLMIDATVTDNAGIESVTLFYRFKGENTFEELAMAKSDQGNDLFTAIVPSQIGVESELEYYIEAVDTGGTKTTRGLSIDPLSRPIVLKQAPETDEAAELPVVAESAASESDTPAVAKPKSNKWWYIAGGVLLIGLAAAAGGGGGSDGGGGTTDTPCADTGCNVTFTLGAP